MLVIPSLRCFSKTLHRALIKQSSLESLGKGWWSLPRNMGGRWPPPPFMKFSRKSPRVWLFLWTQFLFLSSFLRSFPILATTIVPSPPVSRVGITILHRRIKCNRASRGGGVDFLKSIFIYSHVSLSSYSVSSSLSLSGDGISECHTEFCIHQHHETFVLFWVDLGRVKGHVLEPFLNILPLFVTILLPFLPHFTPSKKQTKLKKNKNKKLRHFT